MLVIIIDFLQREGPAEAGKIAEYLIHRSPAADLPNARRGSGLSSANQAIVTSRNLGLVERGRKVAALTALGRRLADTIGTPDEQGTFREVILANPGFVWFWERVVAQGRTVARGDVLELAERLFPAYNLETRKTLVGVCLNYARAAGLLREGPGGSRYTVSNHRLHSIGARDSGAVAADRADMLASAAPAAQETPGFTRPDSLREVARLLGWALADDKLLSDPGHRHQAFRALENASELGPSPHEKALIKLAEHQARAAFESRDPRLLMWTVRLVNILLAGRGEETLRPGDA